MSYTKVFNANEATHDEWLAFRRNGIGGSDMAALLGLNKWRSVLDVWLDKTGQTEPDTEGNRFTYWGIKLEALVADEFALQTGYKVRNNNFTLQSDEHPWMLANIDREIVGVDAGLECKTASAYKRDEWEGDSVPDAYYIQCQHYMAVTGKSSWWIACLLGGNDFVYKEIPRNQEVIDAIIAQGEVFWNEFVIPKVMPATDGSKACTEAIRSMFKPEEGTSIDLPDTADLYFKQYFDAKEREDTAKEEKTAAQNALRLMLGNNQSGICGTHTVKYSKSSKAKPKFNEKAFADEWPDLYTMFLEEGKANAPRLIIK